MAEVTINIIKHANSKFLARITMNELDFELGTPFDSRYALRLSLQELCKHLGEGNFTVIDEGSPRFEDDQKKKGES